MLAIIGFGNHVVKNILPALRRINVSVSSIVVRDINNYSIDDVNKYNLTDSFENTLNNKKITHVYIATPNSTHVELSTKALSAKKHVLCEKPVSDSSLEVKGLLDIACANGCKFIEMSMFTLHKQFSSVVDLITTKEFGDLKTVRFSFKIPHLDPDNVRYSPLLLGGALLDLGFYPITATLKIFPDAELIGSNVFSEDGYDVDTHGAALFRYNSVNIICEWGFGYAYRNYIELEFSEAIVNVDRAFSKPTDFKSRFEIKLLNGDNKVRIIDADDHFGNIFQQFLKFEECVEYDISILNRSILFEAIK
jgi:NDP-hexose-3-ketoreductase